MIRSGKSIYRPCERCGTPFKKSFKRQKFCKRCRRQSYRNAGQLRKQTIYTRGLSPKWFQKKVTSSTIGSSGSRGSSSHSILADKLSISIPFIKK